MLKKLFALIIIVGLCCTVALAQEQEKKNPISDFHIGNIAKAVVKSVKPGVGSSGRRLCTTGRNDCPMPLDSRAISAP